MELAQPQRILIVEDDLALQPFWDVVLKRCFHVWHSDWAVSGEQAEKMILNARKSGLPYSLIISDIFLAGSRTGLDLIRSNRDSQSSTRFLLVSVADESRVKNAVIDLTAMKVVLTKPLNVPKCERAINELVGLRVS